MVCIGNHWRMRLITSSTFIRPPVRTISPGYMCLAGQYANPECRYRSRIDVGFTYKDKFMDVIKVDYFGLMGNMRSVLTGSQECIFVQGGNRRRIGMFIHLNVIKRYSEFT